MREARIQICVYMTFTFAAVFILPNAGKINESINCPGPLMYYMDLGCKPVYEGNHCAKRFDCDHVKTRSVDKCYINGHEYNHRQVLNQEDANVCDFLCICTRMTNHYNTIAAFECKEFSCHAEVPKRGCYLRQDPSKCCGNSKEICLDNGEGRPVCKVNGQMYYDGQPFEVEKHPELNCICKPGYKGKNIPPFCIKNNHSRCFHPAFDHIDYFGQNCAPVFLSKTSQCYERMKCKNSNDRVIPFQLFPSAMDDSNNTCLFGDLIMQINDTLKPTLDITRSCVQCTCEVPPVLTCYYVSKKECHTILVL